MKSAGSTAQKMYQGNEKSNAAASTGPAEGGQVGDALRAVYREAIDEQIPDEMLDLLKKLD